MQMIIIVKLRYTFINHILFKWTIFKKILLQEMRSKRKTSPHLVGMTLSSPSKRMKVFLI